MQFKEVSQIILAVASGRADAFTTTVLSSMIAKEKNPGLGTFNNPKPRAALPGYFGIRSEPDSTFRTSSTGGRSGTTSSATTRGA